MDFGSVLARWDAMQKSGGAARKNNGANSGTRKKANAPWMERDGAVKAGCAKADGSAAKKSEEEWIGRYGVIDKDSAADAEKERERERSSGYAKNLPIEAVIDLHGLTRDEAMRRLEGFVASCARRGMRKILVIHGKGIHTSGSDPVLGDATRDFIERDSRCGMSGHPDARGGGSGATWIALKGRA